MDDQNKGVNERWNQPGTKPERGYAGDEPAAEPRATQLRADIERTRADMGETIDAIQDRLRPGNVASRAADSVREATVGRVRQMASSAEDAWDRSSRDWADGYGVIDRIRDHPVPAALAAASLVWLAFSRRSYDSRAIYGSTRYGEPYLRETHMRDAGSRGERDYGSRSAGEYGVESGARDAGRAMRETAEDLGERARSMTHEATSRARSATREATAGVRRSTRRAQSRLERMARENPLAIGGLAAAAGAIVGLALPETHRENELMGETREAMFDQARSAVRDAAERVQDAAQQAGSVAGDVLAGTGAASESGSESRGQSRPDTSTSGPSRADSRGQTSTSSGATESRDIGGSRSAGAEGAQTPRDRG